MNKYSSIIGFVLIAAILFGYTAYQKSVYNKHAAEIARADSIRVETLRAEHEAAAERAAQLAEQQAAQPVQEAPVAQPAAVNFHDAELNAHSVKACQPALYKLENDVLELEFTSAGAQIYSAKLKNFTAYDSTALYLVKPEQSYYNISFFAGANLKSSDFVFDVASVTDSTIVFRLPFECGGYIEQVYALNAGSYNVKNDLSFNGLETVIPRNVTSFDVDWNLVVPRFEKGYKNEKMYSKLDYYADGDKTPDNIGNGGRDSQKSIPASISWFAFQQQFFSAIMYAQDDFESADFSIKFFSENNKYKNLMNCMARTRHGFDIRRNEPYQFEFYLGPNHFSTLQSFDRKYEKIITLGSFIVRWVSRWVIIPSFNFLSKFISNWGLIILLMTIFIKILVSPLTIKTLKSSATMALLRPDIEKINEKYPKQEDAMKKQQATMELYKKAGVNPAGGCLPMLLQFPVLFAMFRFFPASIELRGQHFLWAEDLSAYDSILDFGFNIPLYGDHISLFAILMAITMFLTSKMQSQSQASNDPQMKSMQFMMLYFMPIMMLFICNNLSSGLTYYYLLSNLIQVIQTWVIKKWFVDEKHLRAEMAKNSKKPVKQSKWMQKLEEVQKAQEAQLKQAQNRK